MLEIRVTASNDLSVFETALIQDIESRILANISCWAPLCYGAINVSAGSVLIVTTVSIAVTDGGYAAIANAASAIVSAALALVEMPRAALSA